MRDALRAQECFSVFVEIFRGVESDKNIGENTKPQRAAFARFCDDEIGLRIACASSRGWESAKEFQFFGALGDWRSRPAGLSDAKARSTTLGRQEGGVQLAAAPLLLPLRD